MSRMSGRELEAIRQKLIALYDNRCWICTRSGKYYPLDVDHWDNNPNNNDWWNKHLLCRSCNTIKDHPLRKSGEELTFSLSPHTKNGQKEAQSLEMEISIVAKPRFYQWLFRLVMYKGSVKYDDVVNGGGRISNVSPDTIKRHYLPVFTAKNELFPYPLYVIAMSDSTLVRVIKLGERWEIARKGIKLKEQVKNWREEE